jgi:cytochrome b
MTTIGETTIRVWDIFVRASHWLVVIGFAISYVIVEDFMTVHVWAGYVVGVLVVLRILWGFVGPARARFSDFVYRPDTATAYLRDLVLLRSKRHLGHSPAGGVMVVTLLVMLAAIVGTGLATYAVRNNAGPLAGIVTADFSLPTAGVTPPADGQEQRSERRRRPGRGWRQLHEWLANFTLLLVGLHIAGVLWASFAHRENLVRAMITGRKRLDPE